VQPSPGAAGPTSQAGPTLSGVRPGPPDSRRSSPAYLRGCPSAELTGPALVPLGPRPAWPSSRLALVPLGPRPAWPSPRRPSPRPLPSQPVGTRATSRTNTPANRASQHLSVRAVGQLAACCTANGASAALAIPRRTLSPQARRGRAQSPAGSARIDHLPRRLAVRLSGSGEPAGEVTATRRACGVSGRSPLDYVEAGSLSPNRRADPRDCGPAAPLAGRTPVRFAREMAEASTGRAYGPEAADEGSRGRARGQTADEAGGQPRTRPGPDGKRGRRAAADEAGARPRTRLGADRGRGRVRPGCRGWSGGGGARWTGGRWWRS
jgi:hypothetical protein